MSGQIEREGWRDVPGYEGHYRVSDFGRVMSVKKEKHHLMKIRPHTGIHDGVRETRYMIIDLRKPGVKKRKMFMHVLMAQVFLPNPLNLPIVDHIDGNMFNFALKNLEWVTREENCRRWRALKKIPEPDHDDQIF